MIFWNYFISFKKGYRSLKIGKLLIDLMLIHKNSRFHRFRPFNKKKLMLIPKIKDFIDLGFWTKKYLKLILKIQDFTDLSFWMRHFDVNP